LIELIKFRILPDNKKICDKVFYLFYKKGMNAKQGFKMVEEVLV